MPASDFTGSVTGRSTSAGARGGVPSEDKDKWAERFACRAPFFALAMMCSAVGVNSNTVSVQLSGATRT